jgi:hypothetical protein
LFIGKEAAGVHSTTYDSIMKSDVIRMDLNVVGRRVVSS